MRFTSLRSAASSIVCRRTAAIVVFLLAGSNLRADQAPSPRALAITDVTVIDVERGARRANMTVLVEKGRIVQVGPSASVRVPRGARVLSGRGRFVIPGLADMHVHQALSLGKGIEIASNAEYFHSLFIANGITMVRDMGGDLAILATWKRDIAAGMRLGPRQWITGQKLGSREVVPDAPFPIRDAADARQSVIMLKERGADFVKVDDLAPALLRAVVDEARRAALPVDGHVSIDTPVGTASDLGQRSIEHLDGVLLACSDKEDDLRERLLLERSPTLMHRILRRLSVRDAIDHPQELPLAGFSETRATALFGRFVRNATWHVPTLRMLATTGVSDSPLVRLGPEAFRIADARNAAGGFARTPLPPSAPQRRAFALQSRVTGMMSRAGVRLLAGTDAPSLFAIPGFSLHDELGLLVAAGLTPAQALVSATSAPAIFAGQGSAVGTVAVGKSADLVLLDADPLDDIANTRHIRAVVVAGRLLERPALDSLQAVAADFVRRSRSRTARGSR